NPKTPAVQSNGHFSKPPSKVLAASFSTNSNHNMVQNAAAALITNKQYDPSDITLVAAVNNSNTMPVGSLPNTDGNLNKVNRPPVLNNMKKGSALTNGTGNANKFSKMTQAITPDMNGFDDFSGYLINFYRRKNFTTE